MAKYSNCGEVIYKILSEYSCLDSQEIQAFGRRLYKEDFTTGSISGHLRKMAEAGIAACSIDEHNKKDWWLTKFGKDKARKDNLIK